MRNAEVTILRAVLIAIVALGLAETTVSANGEPRTP
jgi:hypothetical protein